MLRVPAEPRLRLTARPPKSPGGAGVVCSRLIFLVSAEGLDLDPMIKRYLRSYSVLVSTIIT